MVVDSGASDSLVPVEKALNDVWQIVGSLITFANGDVGRRITHKGLMCLKGNKIPAFVSYDVTEGLLSTVTRLSTEKNNTASQDSQSYFLRATLQQ